MSIDEPIENLANVNSNANTQSIHESNSNTVSINRSSVSYEHHVDNTGSLSIQESTANSSSTVIKPASNVLLFSGSNNFNPNNPDSAKSSVQTIPANASSAAKTSVSSENLRITESLKEKKQKLTLALNVSQSPLSEQSSISSCESNKPNKVLGLKINNSTPNSTPNIDLVKYLDNNNTTTPCLDKLIFDFNSGNGLPMKTPASATLNYLTPNGTFPSGPIMQSQFSYPGINIFNTNEFKTPSEENSNIAVSLANHSQNNNSFINSNNTSNTTNNNNNNNTSNSSNSNIDNPNQYQRQNSELNEIYVNPNDIFNNNNSQVTNNIPKYTSLVNIPELIVNDNRSSPKLSTNNVTGNYILVENVDNNNNSANKILSNSSQDQIQSNNVYNIMTNATNKQIKDEFQTVPEYPSVVKKAKAPAKRKTGNTTANTVGNKSKQAKLNSLTTDTLIDSLNNQDSGSINDKRDTANSSIDSSNLEAYSPINMDNQARMKIEIKRERNREAARKCRTRKLEKIAHLEIQVKNLSAANELERAKNESLAEEIAKIRQKLDMHKKVYNCDLKY